MNRTHGLSLQQLTGLWEVPLLLVSLLLGAGTLWLLQAKPVPETPRVAVAAPEKPLPTVAPQPGVPSLREVLALARGGKFPKALSRLETLRDAAGTEEERLRIDLLRAEILEGMGSDAALAEAAAICRARLESLPEGTDRGEARLRMSRAELKRLDLDPSQRDLERLGELALSLGAAREELGKTPLADEASLLLGETQESLGHLPEAQASYARVGPARPALRAAALVHLASCMRKRSPPALAEAQTAVREALSQGLAPSAWMAEPALTRELELLAQAWREADQDADALLIEQALLKLAADPLPHALHMAEIHERRAERLEAAGELGEARARRRLAAEACLAPLEAGQAVPYAGLLFRAAASFGKAGDTDRAIRALERFVERYPDDGKFPQAVYLLACQYRALGLYERSLKLFDRTRASMLHESGTVHYIPLALYEEGLCHALSRSEGSRDRAIAAFRRILDLPDIFPESATWRDALFALASLECEAALAQVPVMPEAVAAARERLEEWLERYPQDPRAGQAHWMLGSLAWGEQAFREAAEGFGRVLERLHQGETPEPGLLALARSAALLGAEALYRQGLKEGKNALVAQARERFLEARDLNLGTWRAPWALARMGDCARSLGKAAEAKTLYEQARWEYGQIGPSAGAPPEGTAGIETLVAWRTGAAARLERAP